MEISSVKDNWYENFFTGINCELWKKAIAPIQTKSEVQFLIDELHLKSGAHILDIPCGTGRHSLLLAKKGFNPTAVDISEDFINDLKKRTKLKKKNIQIIHEKCFEFKI